MFDNSACQARQILPARWARSPVARPLPGARVSPPAAATDSTSGRGLTMAVSTSSKGLTWFDSPRFHPSFSRSAVVFRFWEPAAATSALTIAPDASGLCPDASAGVDFPPQFRILDLGYCASAAPPCTIGQTLPSFPLLNPCQSLSRSETVETTPNSSVTL